MMIVQTGILAVDGFKFTERAQCPACGDNLAPHDTKERQFAVLLTGGEERTLSVFVKRFHCRSCHQLSYADAPFYPETRIGSPIIDLCLALSMTMPVNRVAAYLDELGIIIDRTSCRLYVKKGREAVANIPTCLATNVLFGVHVPLSVVSLSTLATNPKVTGISGKDILDACGYPSLRKIPQNRPCPEKGQADRFMIEGKGPGARV